MADNPEGHRGSGGPPDGDKPFDPMEAWRSLRDASLDAWAKGMIEAVNTDAYAKATGAMLDAYLAASTPFREALEKSMTQSLQQLSMPTRADFESLAERMTSLEMRFDDLDAKVDDLTMPPRTDTKPSKKEPV